MRLRTIFFGFGASGAAAAPPSSAVAGSGSAAGSVAGAAATGVCLPLDFADPFDFGSGGGLPAIPMAIVTPSARFHLVEADQKKWAFLKHAVRECWLKAQVYGDRLSRLLQRLPAGLRFSLVVSRAVGNPEEWVPTLKDHLMDGARIALFQGSPEAPKLEHFTAGEAVPLPRGESNYLVVLTFHVEHS